MSRQSILLDVPDMGPKISVTVEAEADGGGVVLMITIKPTPVITTKPEVRRRRLMGPATPVVRRFGGKRALAGMLGIPESTIHSWMVKGVIPPKWHAPLITLGSKRGLVVMLADLIASPHPAE